MSRPLELLISDLWHISRTALSSKPNSRYDRCVYIKQSLVKHYPDAVANMSDKKIWFTIEKELNNV